MADLKTTNIYGDAYINNKVGIATNAPATRLQIGQLLPTAATEGIQFGDDTSARIYRDSSTVIKVSGGFTSTTFINAGNYLQTSGNLIYPASQTATQRLEVGNASGNAWIDGLTIAQGGNVTVYNNLTTPTATVSGYITFPNDTTAAGLINTAGTAWLRLDDGGGNMHMGNVQSGAGIYCDSNAFYWRTINGATTLLSLNSNGDLGAARYLSGTYVNTSDDTSSATVSYIMAKFGDNYHRSAPAAKVAAFLNNQTMSIAGNAATATALTSMNISQFTNNSGYLTSAVTSAVAGTGISVSGATGAVTITNNGVTSAVAGTGVGVSGATGAVTFSIGQAVGTANSPTFATLQLTRLNFGATGAAPYAAAAGEGTGNGITFGGDEAGVGYRIFTSMENIGGNYSKLTFNWHTGIRIGAYYGYGGTRFYNNSVGTGTEIFSVGNTDNNVRVVNSLIVNGITINQERATNARMYGTTTGAFGLLGVDSAGSFRWQIYGDASSHGFLDSTWGNWDIKKTINGELDLRVSSALVRVLNSGNAAYAYNMNQYVRTTDTCSFAALTVSNTITGAVSGNAGTVTNGLYTTGGQTIAGITYFSNGESINAYGIRGRFTNEYLHLYNKVGIGSPNGWGQGETSTPIYGLSTYGGLNIAYGDNGISTFNGVIRANSNIRQGADLAMPLSSWSVGGTSTGMVIFSFPGNTSNYGMVHCVFDIYEYNSNAVSTVIVGGHNWNGGWYNTGANVIGRCGKSVRLGAKDSKFCVVFGGAASSWEYGTIVLRKIHNGGFYTGVMDMGGSFTTQQTITESFSNISGDLRALRTSADFIADGGISGTTGTFSGELNIAGNYQIRNTIPTITFRDTDHRTGFIHVNSNIFYILTGVADSGYGNWTQVANSRWPLELNLSTNNAVFGADVNAISFTGAGTGLTGTAASLNIGGNANNITQYTVNQSVGTSNTPTFSELTLTGVGMGNYNLMKYSGLRSGDWQTFTTTEGQLNVIQVNNITGGGHTNYPTGVYGYGAVMSWRTTNHSFQLYAAHTGDLAYKTQWGNDNYSGWRRILDSTNYPYAANMNQYVRTTDTCSFAALTVSSTINGSVTGNAGTATNVAWSGITSKPTTLSGFGITDAFPLSGGTITGNSTFSADNYLTFGPNSSWSRYLRIGGNGYTAPVTTMASVVTTNGNLHLDAAKAAGMGIYFNWYGGTGGVLFGNGSGTQVGAVDGSGNASFIGALGITGVITGASFSGAGTGLSGTAASLSIGGNAVTAGGLSVHGGTNNEANKIVRTDGNGYINAGWINTPSGDMPDTQSINRIYCSDDQYIRYKGVADFKQQIGLTYKNATPRSSNTTDTNYWTGVMGWGTTDLNDVATWGSGFFDTWSSPGNGPGTTSHYVGLQAFHYSGGANTAYGFQMVSSTNANRFHLRSAWSTWQGWVEMLTSGNYNSFAPTLTGTGASGTWAINITGNAATATTATNVTIANGSVTLAKIENITAYTILGNSNASATATPAALSVATVATMLSGQTMNINGSSTSISGFNNPTTAASGNTIVYRDGSGHITGNYIFGSYLNSTDNVDTGTITNIVAKFGDNYHRSATAAKVAAFITGQTMNINGSSTSCSGNAATATNVAASGITGQTGMWTSAARPGPYRLYRRDSDDDYSVQNYWTGVYWRLDGYYSNNTLHAGCSVSYADTAATANALTTGNTYQVANLGIGVAASNRLHINGDGVNPTIRIDNTVFGTGSSSSRVFFGWLPISINVFGTVTTKYIQLYNS